MLQLNPNEIIKINKQINNSLDIIKNNILYLKKKYENTNMMDILDIDNIDLLADRINNSTSFLTGIINELVEATGESIDKLLNANHTLNYYDNKLLAYYANKINNNENEKNLNYIDLCYSKDNRLTNYCQKQNFIEYVNSLFNKFDPEEFGLDKEKVIDDLVYVYDKRGSTEAYNIIRALINNKPQNYHEYNFKPSTQMYSNKHYDYNNNTINNYETNSEIINVNGYEYEIAQVLPKDCTLTERLAYDFGKANIINTMRTLPNKYLELCSQGSSNTITLTCSRNAMNNNANWSGYYKPSAVFSNNDNMITIDIHGSFIDNSFYTQDTLIHEMGHKFDDILQNKNIIDWIFGNITYTTSNNSWSNLYSKYNNVLSGINLGGYENYPNVNEFFGDATVAYFKEPIILKTLCPEIYSEISKMLDGEYGYSYNDKIINVLSSSN